MFGQYYYQIIERVTAGFGTLFNQIYVANKKNNTEIERYRVPIAYASKQKWWVRGTQDNDDELIRSFDMALPRIGYELVSITYAPERKLQTTQRTASYLTNGSYQSRLEKVPYDLQFDLYILCKNTTHGWQVLEQILPYFGPDYTLTFKDFPVDPEVMVPVSILGSPTFKEDYEGSFDERKNIEIKISFIAKVNFYSLVRTAGHILESTVNLSNFHSYMPAGTTMSPYGYEIPTYGITGATFASVMVGVTGGATAGSFGPTGTYYTVITEFNNGT